MGKMGGGTPGAEKTKMAISSDLEAFFLEFDKLLEKVESCQDNLLAEYLERHFESYLKILLTIISKVETFETARTNNECPPCCDNYTITRLNCMNI